MSSSLHSFSYFWSITCLTLTLWICHHWNGAEERPLPELNGSGITEWFPTRLKQTSVVCCCCRSWWPMLTMLINVSRRSQSTVQAGDEALGELHLCQIRGANSGASQLHCLHWEALWVSVDNSRHTVFARNLINRFVIAINHSITDGIDLSVQVLFVRRQARQRSSGHIDRQKLW